MRLQSKESQMSDEQAGEVRFTREEFYERIWSKPATKLAAELGCSDVMLCKICRTHQIPKPWPGYWAQVEHGRASERAPLPKCDDAAIQLLVFNRHSKDPGDEPEAEPEPVLDPDIQQMLENARAMGPVLVK